MLRPGCWECVYIWCDRRSSPSDDAVCTSLAQSRVGDWGVDQCQETREIDDQLWDLLGGATPSQSGALPKVVPSGFLTRRSAQETFRSADSVADEDLIPVEHIPTSARPFFCACLPHRKSSKRGHEGHRESRRFSAINIVDSRLADCRRPEVTPCPACTFVADKFPEESLVKQRDVCVLDSCCFAARFTVARRPTPSKRNSPRLSLASDPSRRNGVEVLSSPDDGFWSTLGGNTILDVEEFRDKQSSVRVW